jgi:beta-glucosidase
MPSSMSEVEKQYEDRPFDMKCHKDTEGNIYDFGFGMNWRGVINDTRVKRFK